MYDLERNIRQWKATIAESNSMTPENVAELESHLRETIDGVLEKGLSEDEAFTIASRRLGTPDNLFTEYVKVNGNFVWKNRMLWILFGWVCGNALQSTVAGISTISGVAAAFSGLGSSTVGMVSIVTTLVCWIILLVTVWQHRRQVQDVANNSNVSNRWLASLFVLLLSGHGLKFVGSNIHARAVELHEFGESYMWISIGGGIIFYFAFASCIAAIAILGRAHVKELQKVA